MTATPPAGADLRLYFPRRGPGEPCRAQLPCGPGCPQLQTIAQAPSNPGTGCPHWRTVATGPTIAAALAHLAAIGAFRAAAARFAHRQHRPGELAEAEAALRAAGTDPATGLISLPAAVIRFTDLRADGCRLWACNGSITGGPVWLLWSDCTGRDYGPDELVQVRGPGYRPGKEQAQSAPRTARCGGPAGAARAGAP
jgi:hypothetical protein